MAKSFKLTVEIPEKRIIDLFISACEGGSNYWCQSLTPVEDDSDAYAAMLHGFTLIDRETGKTHRIGKRNIALAMQRFPTECPQAFADLIKEDDDASTGDQFLQLCVFGEVIYG